MPRRFRIAPHAFVGRLLAVVVVVAMLIVGIGLPLAAGAELSVDQVGFASPETVVPRQARYRVGLQAGHWLSWEMPAELARLRPQTGTYGGGVNEWELNLGVARRVARTLEEYGFDVDVIPATVPPSYLADAFVAFHADGDASGRLSGFKLAGSRRSLTPEQDQALIDAITVDYRAATGLRVDPNISRNMTGYYAFNHTRFTHAIDARTPAVILEMGFMTHWGDLDVLLNDTDSVAWGVSRGILRYFGLVED